MSRTKRKRYGGAFKPKVGLEALIGLKTVGKIAWEYQGHPVQVTQWKRMNCGAYAGVFRVAAGGQRRSRTDGGPTPREDWGIER